MILSMYIITLIIDSTHSLIANGWANLFNTEYFVIDQIKLSYVVFKKI